MMKWMVVCGVCVLLAGAWTFGADRTVVNMVFRHGVNHYEGCVLGERWNANVRSANSRIDGRTLKFGDLRLAGDDVRIESAELRLAFAEEGLSRIRNADLEVYDGAEVAGPHVDDRFKDGKALSLVEYRDAKLVGMDPKTRVVAWSVPPTLVKRWLDKPETNKGLTFKVVPLEKVSHEFIFSMHANNDSECRPMLIVRYSFTGEVAPFAPEITTRFAGKTFGPVFPVKWRQKAWDLNGTPVSYEVAVAPTNGEFRTVGKASPDALSFDVITGTLDTQKAYRVRLRAVDPTGLTSDWVPADGEFRVSRETCVVWTQNAVTKVPREEIPPTALVPVTLAAARNEFESFQVVVTGLSNLKEVDVNVGDLTGPDGAKISRDAFSLYRVHYVDCKGEGWLPDSMVPWRVPGGGPRIGGEFGAPFKVEAGTNALVWVELHVPEDAAPGEYKGSIEVTQAGKGIGVVPVSLTVWPVTLPKTTSLLTFMELTWRHPKRAYLNSLHAHRIDPWFVQANEDKTKPEFTKDWEHDVTKDKDGKLVMKWNPEFDRNLAAYFDGSLFEDGVPGKSYLFGYGMWWISGKLTGNNDEDRIAILRQFEEHYKDKPYVGRLYWFFIDEPNEKTIAKCVKVGKQIKEYSPSIKFLLTTRYRDDLVGLVDVWDPIINREVIDWDAPGPDVYRDEVAKGRTAINCITVNSQAPTSPNIFIYHGTAMNTRIWTWVTYACGLEGIEFWRCNPAPSVLTPRRFGGVWGDGSLFYRGLPEELGTEEEIALPSIRLKILRDGIEDFELLSMLAKKEPALAKKLCRRMVQETKGYDGAFSKPVQHVSHNWNTDGKGDRMQNGYVIWESDPKRLAETRAAIAEALAK